MKKNIVYLMLASLLLFTGCANYLDQDPSMDKIFSSKIETTKWYNRIYSDDFMVQEMHYSGQIPYFWCTDESAYILESHVRNIAEGKMSPDNYYGYTGYNLYFFVRYYQAIRHCNLFLENVDKCAELGEIDRRTMRAEARFMRAYYHYLLLRLYGPIPIVETSRSADQIGASQARNTLGECVRWINGEIDWACENGMPAARDEKFTLGLPTIGAARAIQSRMLLMVASPLFNGNSAYKNWTNHDGTVLMPQTYDKELWKDAADAAKEAGDQHARPAHLVDVDAHAVRRLRMLAARHQAQTEAGLIEQDVGRGEQQRGHEHEPAELERAEIDGERLLRTGILHDGGNVIGIRRGVDGLDNDRRARGAEQIQRGADKRLVRLEVDAGHGQQAGIDGAQHGGGQQDHHDHQEGGGVGGQVAHGQRTAQGAHDHDALQTQVDDAGVLREAAAQSHQDQHGSEGQSVLQQQYHY